MLKHAILTAVIVGLSTITSAHPLSSTSSSTGTTITSNSSDLVHPPPSCHITNAQRKAAAHDWFQMWNTNNSPVDIASRLLHPNITLYQDRFPSSNGSRVANLFGAEQIKTFVNQSRLGFSKYEFEEMLEFGEGRVVGSRWALRGVLDGKLFPPPAGTNVTYNGTDIFILECGTGRIEDVWSAQDLITFYHELRIPIGKNGTV